MRILVDITHPAHVHFFRNAINVWRRRGHEVAITVRDKDITLQLLDEYGYEYTCLSRARQGIIGLGLELLEHEGKLLRIIVNFRPNVLLEIGGTFIVHVGKLTRTPALVFYDTENARLSNAITYPFADAICTPSCYKDDLGPKHIRYEGYQELAYLHTNWFVPDQTVLKEVGLSKNEPFSIVRFVGWTSGHDVNMYGFSMKGKQALVNCLGRFGRVIITSESPLPSSLEKYRMGISPTKIHDLLFFASLYVGESATMASESAILGTPAIFVSPVGRGYTHEQEDKYGLVCNFSSQAEDAAIAKAREWLARDDLKAEWSTKRDRMLSEKIDVTQFIVDIVEKYGQDINTGRTMAVDRERVATTRSFEHSLQRVLEWAHAQDYIGYGKFDALNSPFLKTASLNRKWLRLIVSQAIKQSPVNLRPLFGVRQFKNPKGMGLFARAYLNLYHTYGEEHYLDRANYCLSWLAENAAQGYAGYCWGYNWDWQDLGFFAPFGSPNCVVTTFVGQAFLDGYECTGDENYLQMASSCLDFIRHDLKVLYEDEAMKCVSYVPSKDIQMVVIDVSALAGALVARVYHHTGEKKLATEARKLINYVMDKQTDYGAWFYTHPPKDSPVKHDNYHTGFILDAILDYELATGDDSFRSAYQRGLNFYAKNLFLPNGAPKWMSYKIYPSDIHGAATGIGTFSRAACYEDKSYIDQARRVAKWAIENMQGPEGYFYYQKGRFWTKKYTLMRWCNAWMAYGLSSLLLAEHDLSGGVG